MANRQLRNRHCILDSLIIASFCSAFSWKQLSFLLSSLQIPYFWARTANIVLNALALRLVHASVTTQLKAIPCNWSWRIPDHRELAKVYISGLSNDRSSVWENSYHLCAFGFFHHINHALPTKKFLVGWLVCFFFWGGGSDADFRS